jgi:nitroreductase
VKRGEFMDVFETIKGRRTVREFSDKEVANETIEQLIDAARNAPSSRDSQPWEFVIIRDKETKEKFAMARDENNRCEKDAPVVIAVCVNTDKSKTRWIEDGNVAAQNIMLAAHSLGLSAVYLTGNTSFGAAEKSGVEKTIIEKLDLPENIQIVCNIAVGYPAKGPEEKQLREVKDMVHYEKF